jgi:hypothetical protein
VVVVLENYQVHFLMAVLVAVVVLQLVKVLLLELELLVKETMAALV